MEKKIRVLHILDELDTGGAEKIVVDYFKRIDSLLHVAGISTERILTGKEDAKEVLKYKIDYNSVNKNIDKFRQDSKKWLLDAIDYKEDTSKHINITDKSDCCGCTACMNITLIIMLWCIIKNGMEKCLLYQVSIDIY